VIYAQLIIDGTEYGVHSFFAQIRDVNHRPLPGVTLGDLGPKLGDGANDTGFMILKDFRIPRTYLLARHQQVTPEGVYQKTKEGAENTKAHYGTMLSARGGMVRIYFLSHRNIHVLHLRCAPLVDVWLLR
jgi:acyl-CoA oxidase